MALVDKIQGDDDGAARSHGTGRAIGGIAQGAITALVLLALWWGVVLAFSPPPFILPAPPKVFATLAAQWPSLLYHAGVTASEIVLGLVFGCVLGVATALLINASAWTRRHVSPLVQASQALPVFAIAPLLVLWFGLGLGSKIAMATLIIYFPIASALSDGLERADRHLIDLARVHGASRWQSLVWFRLPAAFPSLASGLRVAATVAPIGAIVGEWVGAAGGLGYIINQANARMQTDVVFAALLLLVAMVLLLRFIVDAVLDRLVHWVPRSTAFANRSF